MSIRVIFTLDYLLKTTIVTPLCWFYSPDKIHLNAQGIEYIYPSSWSQKKNDDFVDPLMVLIGFVIKQEVNNIFDLFFYLIKPE